MQKVVIVRVDRGRYCPLGVQRQMCGRRVSPNAKLYYTTPRRAAPRRAAPRRALPHCTMFCSARCFGGGVSPQGTKPARAGGTFHSHPPWRPHRAFCRSALPDTRRRTTNATYYSFGPSMGRTCSLTHPLGSAPISPHRLQLGQRAVFSFPCSHAAAAAQAGRAGNLRGLFVLWGEGGGLLFLASGPHRTPCRDAPLVRWQRGRLASRQAYPGRLGWLGASGGHA